MKYIKLIKENIKSFIIIFFLLLLIVLLLFFIFSGNKEEKIIENKNEHSIKLEEEIKKEEEYLPIIFLTEEELIDLGLNVKLKAQVVNRDPLVYKIIKSDEDIFKQLK